MRHTSPPPKNQEKKKTKKIKKKKSIPLDCIVKRRSLIAIDAHPLRPDFASHVGPVQVHQANMVQPHILVGIGRLAIRELKIDIVAQDETVVTRHHGVVVVPFLHAVRLGVLAPGHVIGAIGDFGALRPEFFKVSGGEGFHLGRCAVCCGQSRCCETTG